MQKEIYLNTMTLYLDDSFHSRAVQFIAVYTTGDTELPCLKQEPLSDCTLPAMVMENNGLHVSGLCHVVRNVVKFSAERTNVCEVKNKKESLLGYKQNCLKACAVVSNWTRFCEVELPLAIKSLTQSILYEDETCVTLPEAFVKLEKEFLVPKKTPNAMKYFKGKKKDSLISRDNVEMNSLPCPSIQCVWSRCGFGKIMEAKIQKIDATIPEMPNDGLSSDDVKCAGDIVWPYLCALNITVADLIVLSCFVELMASVGSFRTFQDILSKLPETYKWILRCFGRESLCAAVQTVWKPLYHGNDPEKTFELPSNNVNIMHVSYEQKAINTKQAHVKITKNLPRILETLGGNDITTVGHGHSNMNSGISWNDLPNEVDPSGGELNKGRAVRKRQQIESMASHILPLLKSEDKVVEFCAGGGHLGIVLAYLKPDTKFVLVDNKEQSIDRAMSRIKSLNLKNVTLYLCNLEYFIGTFDVGITLHACGTATDLVLNKCIQSNASFVVCPCCYGGIRSTTDVTYPKSTGFSCLTPEDYILLAHSADQTNSNHESDYNKQGKNSMLLIDIDRIRHAKDNGKYNTIKVYTMIPQTCSPKNNMIVGISM